MSGLITIQSFSSGWQIFTATPALPNPDSASNPANTSPATTAPVTAGTDPGAASAGSVTVGTSAHVGGCSSNVGSANDSGSFEDLFQQMSDALTQLQQFMAQFEAQLSALFAPQGSAASGTSGSGTDTTGTTASTGTAAPVVASTDPTTPVTTTTTDPTTTPPTTTPVTSGSTASQPSTVDIRARERFSFDFVTQEGDVVHLRLGIRAEAAAAQDGSGNTLSGASLSERISMSVKGQLNAQEMAAIASVVSQVEGAGATQAAGTTPVSDSSPGLNIDTSQLASVGFRASLRISAEYATLAIPVSSAGATTPLIAGA